LRQAFNERYESDYQSLCKAAFGGRLVAIGTVRLALQRKLAKTVTIPWAG
jgi:hypothetical protein